MISFDDSFVLLNSQLVMSQVKVYLKLLISQSKFLVPDSLSQSEFSGPKQPVSE